MGENDRRVRGRERRMKCREGETRGTLRGKKDTLEEM